MKRTIVVTYTVEIPFTREGYPPGMSANEAAALEASNDPIDLLRTVGEWTTTYRVETTEILKPGSL
jgi:hypothetical protein